MLIHFGHNPGMFKAHGPHPNFHRAALFIKFATCPALSKNYVHNFLNVVSEISFKAVNLWQHCYVTPCDPFQLISKMLTVNKKEKLTASRTSKNLLFFYCNMDQLCLHNMPRGRRCFQGVQYQGRRNTLTTTS